MAAQILQYPPKFPDTKLEYTFDWKPLLRPGETLSGEPTIVVAGTTGCVVSDISTDANKITRFKIAGGAVSSQSRVQLSAQTDGEQIIGYNVALPIKAR